MGTGHSTGGTYLADDLAFFNSLPQLDVDFAQMGKHADHSLPVIDVDQVSAKEKITELYHPATGRGSDRYTFVGGDIHATMGAPGLAVEYTAAPETAGHDACHGL
jgi:hypothetical protein